MAYKSSLDIIEINGLVFSDVLSGDFVPSRNGDKYLREMDSTGTYQDYENPDNSGTITLQVKGDTKATNFRKELRRLMETGTTFNLTRNNKNKGGEKAIYKNCLVVNDGSSSKGKDGKLVDREWTISYERDITNEGAN